MYVEHCGFVARLLAELVSCDLFSVFPNFSLFIYVCPLVEVVAGNTLGILLFFEKHTLFLAL